VLTFHFEQYYSLLSFTAVFIFVHHSRDIPWNVLTRFWLWRCGLSISKAL